MRDFTNELWGGLKLLGSIRPITKSMRQGQFSNQAGCPYGVGVHQTQSTGQDPSGLGRWAWTRYRGRQGIHLRVVTAYRPVLNTSGALSVWNQQKAHFETKDDDRCPRAIFTDDMLKEIRNWKEEWDQIVIGIDANEDVHTGKLAKAF